MLLLTGATGFVGRTVIRQLAEEGTPVRILLNPSRESPDLPSSVPMEVALASPTDPRGVRAALVGVTSVVHLAGEEGHAARADRLRGEVDATRTLAEAASDAGVDRFIFLSALGVDRSSAYPLMRAKAEAEEAVRNAGIPFTILRSGAVFGEGDRFTTALAMMMASAPLLFPMPGDGSTLLQPLWVEDLATCIVWILDEPSARGEIYEIGGPEFLTFSQVVQLVMQATGMSRIVIPVRPPYLKAAIWLSEAVFPRPPVTTAWIDYLAVNRTAHLDTLVRIVGLRPSRMETRLGYLAGRNWAWELLTRQFVRRNGTR